MVTSLLMAVVSVESTPRKIFAPREKVGRR